MSSEKNIAIYETNSVIKNHSSCNEALIFENVELLFTSLKLLYNSVKAIDEEISVLNKNIAFSFDLIPQFNTLSKLYTNEILLHKKVYNLMEQVSFLFRKHLTNHKYSVGEKTLRGWLHIDTTFRTVKIKKSHNIFKKYGDLQEGELRWRIGNFNEKRLFTYSIFNSKSPLFLRAYNEESKINKKIILEFEAIMTLILALRQKIRFIDTHIVQSYDSLLTITNIQEKLKM